jgi:NADH:ubiquinone oxidoreductase subunit E
VQVAQDRIESVARELGVPLMSEEELAEFTAAFEAAHQAADRSSHAASGT